MWLSYAVGHCAAAHTIAGAGPAASSAGACNPSAASGCFACTLGMNTLEGIAHRTQTCTCAMAALKQQPHVSYGALNTEDVFRDEMRPLHARDQTQPRNLQAVMHAKPGLARSASALYVAGVRGALASARPSARPFAAVQSRAQCPSAPQAKHTLRRLPPGPASPRAWSLH